MTQDALEVKTIAPLQNVSLCLATLRRTMNREPHLPGLVTFHGPSGYGKSWAATYAANKYRAYYVEAKSSWTKKALCLSILKEMGIEPARQIWEMEEQIGEQLALSQRPLIIDECDHIVAKNAIETIRDIYESSQASIMLIGEERLPQKLERWERLHGRMLHWEPAEPASSDDARTLARHYCTALSISDELLEALTGASQGSVRRICVNLEKVREFAARKGLEAVGLQEWGDNAFFTGQPPKRRV